jgi:hypothetical protein
MTRVVPVAIPMDSNTAPSIASFCTITRFHRRYQCSYYTSPACTPDTHTRTHTKKRAHTHTHTECLVMADLCPMLSRASGLALGLFSQANHQHPHHTSENRPPSNPILACSAHLSTHLLTQTQRRRRHTDTDTDTDTLTLTQTQTQARLLPLHFLYLTLSPALPTDRSAKAWQVSR